MNLLSPRDLFQQDAVKAGDHRKLCLETRVREALLAAFAELSWRLPKADNPQSSWAANARRQGAQELIEIFLSLGDPPREMKRTVSGQLEPEDAHHAKRTERSHDGQSD